ncbi:MAG: EamA/RhaT family transporter [Proteobacteria bacterium]|nr:MAG: EamA/RhaT family transporter [Pseudomonadota bacterium]
MVGSAIAFSVMSLFVKWAGQRLPSQELVFARSVASFAMSFALLRRAGVSPWGRRRGLLVLRGLYGFGGLSCAYYAITHLPLAEATLLSYLHPIFTALLATRVLGERADRSLVASLALGSAGVLLVTRPFGLLGAGQPPLDPLAVAVALGGAFFVASAYVGVRQLSATEHPLVIVMYFPMIAAPASLPATLRHGVWPAGVEWIALAGVALFAQLGQIWITKGLAHEPAGRATALSYLQIAFAALWGAAIFGEIPGPATALGTALIFAGTLVGARASRRAAAAAPLATLD